MPIARIKLVGPRNPAPLIRAKSAFWERLKEMEHEAFIPGSLRELGPRAYSLALRKGDKVQSWYVPAKEVREVRAMTETYREARELLAKIGQLEFALLKLRIEKRRQDEQGTKTTPRVARKTHK